MVDKPVITAWSQVSSGRFDELDRVRGSLRLAFVLYMYLPSSASRFAIVFVSVPGLRFQIGFFSHLSFFRGKREEREGHEGGSEKGRKQAPTPGADALVSAVLP